MSNPLGYRCVKDFFLYCPLKRRGWGHYCSNACKEARSLVSDLKAHGFELTQPVLPPSLEPTPRASI